MLQMYTYPWYRFFFLIALQQILIPIKSAAINSPAEGDGWFYAKPGRWKLPQTPFFTAADQLTDSSKITLTNFLFYSQVPYA